MSIWQKFLEKWNKWIEDLKAFSAKRWGTIWVICALIAGGGFLSAIMGWPFAFFVPAWILFVAYLLKKGYKGEV